MNENLRIWIRPIESFVDGKPLRVQASPGEVRQDRQDMRVPYKRTKRNQTSILRVVRRSCGHPSTSAIIVDSDLRLRSSARMIASAKSFIGRRRRRLSFRRRRYASSSDNL